jgi:CIC family chloride channel protein
MSVGEALALMDERSLDALPVQENGRVGVVTRVGLERFLGAKRRAARPEPAVAATEIPR